MFTLGYNTNGLAHHRLSDALELLAGLGYGAVALTPDVGHLDPLLATEAEVLAVRRQLEGLGLRCVVETGARYTLDPRRKHFPTLLEDAPADRRRRLDLLRRHVDLAVGLGAPRVSIWSGAAPDGAREGQGAASEARLWDRLAEGVAALLEHARGAGVEVAFEPEPGMFVERPAGFTRLLEHLGSAGDELGLTLDVGHLVVTGDLPAGEVIRSHASRLRNVHLDDCPRGVHLHGPFGTGDLDLADVLSALIEVGYSEVASVELSRDSHRGAAAAEEALSTLRGAPAEGP
jgi:sugar phosphate isomerase/epimerase